MKQIEHCCVVRMFKATKDKRTVPKKSVLTNGKDLYRQ